MADSYEHLKFQRENFETNRRSGQPPRGPETPADIRSYGRSLAKEFQEATHEAGALHPGYDSRLLLKLTVGHRLRPTDFEFISGVEFVSQAGDDVVLVFADEHGLLTFRSRIEQLIGGSIPTRKALLFALDRMGTWTRNDRMGQLLSREGVPSDSPFLVDVELWPLLRDREEIESSFQKHLRERELTVKGTLRLDAMTIFRLSVREADLDWLLEHRDVRLVDLPPTYSFEPALLDIAISELDEIPRPPADAPALGVLDSGIVANHPLLAPAVGDTQSFHEGITDPADKHGHGTAVAGIGLYGDVEARLESLSFAPQLTILSGKVLEDDNSYDNEFIENRVIAAVREFREEYACRVFVLSISDARLAFDGRGLRPLAVTLDELSRKEGVLFVVPAGNAPPFLDQAADYPDYLLEQRVADPGTSLNALTVGSIAERERGRSATRQAARGKETIEEIPIAMRGQPSPFTRCGPSIGGAMKPDLVAVGGNSVVDRYSKQSTERGLGRLTLSINFASGKPLTEMAGTSFAAPHVAHLATRLFGEYDDMTPDLARALLVANAAPSPESVDLLHYNAKPTASDHERVARLCGYGVVDDDTLFRSAEDDVCLLVREKIANKQHHFFELPVPADFFSAGLRRREVVVSLAYTPPVRSTRADYRAAKIYFHLIEAPSLADAKKAFDAATDDDEHETISELDTGRSHPTTRRNKGTVQCSRWTFKSPTAKRRDNRMFVVVTRNDPYWGESVVEQLEAYALVVKIRDRENENARLYTQIRQTLQVRVAERNRARSQE